MKRILLILAICAVVTLAIGKLFFSPQGIDPIPDSQIELTKVIDEMTFKLTDQGVLYRVDDRTGKWHYHDTVVDLPGMQAAYRTEGDVVYRISPETSESIATKPYFHEGFEDLPVGVAGTRKMIGIERGWGALTLQSPATPQVNNYSLRVGAQHAMVGSHISFGTQPAIVGVWRSGFQSNGSLYLYAIPS